MIDPNLNPNPPNKETHQRKSLVLNMYISNNVEIRGIGRKDVCLYDVWISFLKYHIKLVLGPRWLSFVSLSYVNGMGKYVILGQD